MQKLAVGGRDLLGALSTDLGARGAHNVTSKHPLVCPRGESYRLFPEGTPQFIGRAPGPSIPHTDWRPRSSSQNSDAEKHIADFLLHRLPGSQAFRQSLRHFPETLLLGWPRAQHVGWGGSWGAGIGSHPSSGAV